MLYKNAVEASRSIIKKQVKQGMIVIDATVGKGNDSLFLMQCIGHKGRFYGFDLDERAISTTKDLLGQYGYTENIHLFCKSHSEIATYVPHQVDCVIFNLGYLPGLSKDHITESSTTLEALKQALLLLKVDGFISVVVYPGHPQGAKESTDLKVFTTTLNQKEFHLFEITYPNQINNPPTLIYISRTKV